MFTAPAPARKTGRCGWIFPRISGFVWIYTEGHADWKLVPASQRSKGRWIWRRSNARRFDGPAL